MAPRVNRWSEETKKTVLQYIKEGKTYQKIYELVGVGKATINRWFTNPNCVLGSGKTCVLSKKI